MTDKGEGEESTMENKAAKPTMSRREFLKEIAKGAGGAAAVVTGADLLLAGCEQKEKKPVEETTAPTEPPVTQATKVVATGVDPVRANETAGAEAATNVFQTQKAATPKPEASPTVKVTEEVSAIDKIVEKYTPERAGFVAKDQDGKVLMIINADEASYAEDKIFNVNDEALRIIQEFREKSIEMIKESVKLHKEVYKDFPENDNMWVSADGKTLSFVTDDGRPHVIDTEMPFIFLHTDEEQRTSEGELRFINEGSSCSFGSDEGSLVIVLQLRDGFPIFGTGALMSPLKSLSRIQQVTGAEPWYGAVEASRYTDNFIENWQARVQDLGWLEYNLREALSK